MLEDTRLATLRAYGDMRRHGLPDRHAYETAVTLFRLRFPDVAGEDASFVVADWICEALGQ